MIKLSTQAVEYLEMTKSHKIYKKFWKIMINKVFVDI